MNTVDSEWIIVGKIGRPHGIKGLVSIISFTEPRESIIDYPNWHIKKKNQWCPISRVKTEVNHKHILAQIAGYTEREDVALLTNFDIAVAKESLPSLDEGEFYWHELIGMTVVHQDGRVLGTVDEIIPTGSNDVLLVQGEQRYLIPYLMDEVVLNIHREKRQITVNWDLDF